uniref:Galectin domain-containing protein n=1 Tax=Ditylenchus dipsaci TaxID=166011 RepID=A0A915CZP1_9BILA
MLFAAENQLSGGDGQLGVDTRDMALLSTLHSCLPDPTKTVDWEEDEGGDTWSWMLPEETQPVSDLISIQGICHIDLLGSQFKITHNEDNNDFFLDLVQSEGSLQSVLQVIFRFPRDRNGSMQIFASSYDLWRKPGRVIVHSASSRCVKQKHWHLQLHVYEHCYTIELNGRLIDTFDHRMAFRKVHKCPSLQLSDLPQSCNEIGMKGQQNC